MRGGDKLQRVVLVLGVFIAWIGLSLAPTVGALVDTTVSAIVKNTPPSIAAEITSPIDGTKQTASPIIVKGLCTEDLLVRLYDNKKFVGSDICENGRFSILIPLIVGTNRLIAAVYDALDQRGPDSNIVDVLYAPSKTAKTNLKLTTTTTRQVTDPGETISWDLKITGGQKPYALLVDWGDGFREPVSLAVAGNFTLEHVYEEAGNFALIIEATDKNGLSTVLQLAVEVRGEKPSLVVSTTNINIDASLTIFLWLIALAMLFYWLGYYFGERRIERREFNQEPRVWT